MPTAGVKSKASSAAEKSSGSGNRSRNRRRRSGNSNRAADPMNGESLTGETRKPAPSIFEGEEERDPFDIDLSAATYTEEDTAAEAAAETSSEA